MNFLVWHEFKQVFSQGKSREFFFFWNVAEGGWNSCQSWRKRKCLSRTV